MKIVSCSVFPECQAIVAYQRNKSLILQYEFHTFYRKQMNNEALLNYDPPRMEVLEVYLEFSIAASANMSPSEGPTEDWSGGSDSWTGDDIAF